MKRLLVILVLLPSLVCAQAIRPYRINCQIAPQLEMDLMRTLKGQNVPSVWQMDLPQLLQRMTNGVQQPNIPEIKQLLWAIRTQCPGF